MLYNIVNYFEEILGVKIELIQMLDHKLAKLPYYLTVNYDYYEGRVLNKMLLFIHSGGRQKYTSLQYEKQINVIQNIFNIPVVLVLDQLESYNRKRLIERKINFVIPGKQIYIPELFLDLKDSRENREKFTEKFRPSSQFILFYHLEIESLENLLLYEIAEITGYSNMTISRALNDLCRAEIFNVTNTRIKTINISDDKATIWNKARKYLTNPIKETFYINKLPPMNYCFKTGSNALSYYTNIANKDEISYAIDKKNYQKINFEQYNEVNLIEGKYQLELWSYDPGKLAKQGYVDPLSLYMTYANDNNERIQKELRILLDKILSYNYA